MGFGIQSRSDFEYLYEVLKEKDSYYAYSELPYKQSRLIYRICLRANKGTVALVGPFLSAEQKAAAMATHGKAVFLDDLTSPYLYDTVIIKDINNFPLWESIKTTHGFVSWDIRGRLGLIQHLKDRYPEHYMI